MTKKSKALEGGFVLPQVRRTEVADVEAERFIDDAPPASAESTTATSTVTRRSTAKRKLARGERLTLYLSPELAAELRVYAARSGRSMSDAVEEAVKMLLHHRPSQ